MFFHNNMLTKQSPNPKSKELIGVCAFGGLNEFSTSFVAVGFSVDSALALGVRKPYEFSISPQLFTTMKFLFAAFSKCNTWTSMPSYMH